MPKRTLSLVAALLLAAGQVMAADRPMADFDLVIERLQKSGTWIQLDEHLFAFQPGTDKNWRPYRSGQWFYTDYGWTWKGTESEDWATTHYGYWDLRDGKWVWIPNGKWLASTVEWLKSGDYIGWRATPLDRFYNPQEPESERYSTPSEWNFTKAENLTRVLTSTDFADDTLAEELLKNAEPCDHIYVSYREIERPGPAPSILQPKDAKPADLEIPIIEDLPDLYTTIDHASSKLFYAYRPKFHQDDDGLMRRIELFLHPRMQEDNQKKIKDTVGSPMTDEEKSEQTRKMEETLELQRRHMNDLYR